MNDGKRDQRHDLEELRELLFGPEKERLDELSERVEVPENFSEKVGEILPRAMQKSARQGDELAEAMMPTVEEIVRLSIRKDINRFADALFPVIGPAIRKSIRETIRQMMQAVNRTIEQSFTRQGLKWRLESMRSGIPVAEIAMLHGLVYRVEQVFLIHRETGLLLCHLEQDDIHRQDPDLVSSMLSAINDFVGDSFDLAQDRSLDSIDVGDFSIWIERGPDAIIAIAIRGEAPNNLRTTLQQTLETIQQELGETLQVFNGDTQLYEERQDLLEDCLQARYREPAGKTSLGTRLLCLVVILFLLYWAGLEIWRDWQQDEYVALLAGEPGYVVTAADEVDGRLVVGGLRDPLAREPSELLRESTLSEEAVAHRFGAYQSLDPAFVERRLRASLAPPDGVRLEFDGTTLVVSGVADRRWRDELRLRAPLIVGIDGLDDSALREHSSLAGFDAPDGVTLTLENGVLYARGAASEEWIRALPGVAAGHDEIIAVDTRALQNLTEIELVEAIETLEGRVILFESGAALEFDEAEIPRISGQARKIVELAGKLERNVLILVKGYSDSVGNYTDNVLLSRQRAEAVARLLVAAGVDVTQLVVKGLEAPIAEERDAAEQRYNRRVEFEVIVE